MYAGLRVARATPTARRPSWPPRLFKPAAERFDESVATLAPLCLSIRIRRACDKKFPKLAEWKRSDGARTILLLEDNDLQLTNQSVVGDKYMPIARGRNDTPDEAYLISTCASRYGWPLLIDGREYFDFAQSEHLLHFEVVASSPLR